IVLAGMQRVEGGDAVAADDPAAARRRMGAHARVAPRAELLAARIRIDLELAAQASFRAVFMSDMGQSEKNSVRTMSSGLPLKADLAQCSRHVSKVPGPEVEGSLTT